MAQTEWFKKVAEECGCKEEEVRQVFRRVNNEFLKDKKDKIPHHEYTSEVMAKVKSELKKGLRESEAHKEESEGYDAFHAGKKRSACPYKKDDEFRKAWLEGWDMAKEDKDDDLKESKAYEKDLDPNKTIIVTGVKGMKSKPFTKKFKNQKAYDKWSDSEEAEDYEVRYVKNESNSYLDKALNTLCEAVAKWYPTDDEIEDYAEKNNLSWGQAEKKLAAQKKEAAADKRDKNFWDNERKRSEREDTRRERENRPPKPKLTKAQYDKLCYGAAHDWMADNPDYEGEDVWFDMADSMMYNKDIKDYLNYSYYSFHKKLPGKQIMKEILADDIYSFVSKAKKDVAKENEAWERKQAKKKKTVKESNFDTYLNLLQ